MFNLARRTAPEQTSPLRVLMIPDLSSGNPYQRLLAEALNRRGVEVALVRPRRRERFPILRGWLSAGRPQVVHVHWTHPLLGLSTERPARQITARAVTRFIWQLRILRLLRVRITWTVHNIKAHETAPSDAEGRIHLELFRAANAVICHCREAALTIQGSLALQPDEAAKIHVIEHGSYVGTYGDRVPQQQARLTLGLPEGVRIGLFIGSIRGYKGVLELIDAFRAIDAVDVRLLIAGLPRPADLEAHVRAAASKDDRILLRLGFVPDNEIPVLLGAADFVILPFRAVLTSGSAILAMSYGKPVVAPRTGCLPELLQPDGARLYDLDEPGALSQAIREELEADSEGRGNFNLTQAGKLDWDSIAAATEQAYRA